MILQLIIYFFIVQIIHSISTTRLYKLAGYHWWYAVIPVYNAIVLMKIIKRPRWWVLLLFLPVINLIMFPVIWVETIRSFGKVKTIDTCLVLGTLGCYITYLNYNSASLIYRSDRSLKPDTGTGEWVSSVLFAVIAATIVHTYVVQPFVIPTSSMEKSMLVGDFLFVSKVHYGARTPITALALPMVHDTIPILKTKSYVFSDDPAEKQSTWLNMFQMPYFRLPGLQDIKRNDIVVFNQPADTLRDMNNFHPDRSYLKPIDKKTNLVKRCVGLPGDTLSLHNGYVYINGAKTDNELENKLQFSYIVQTNGSTLSKNYMYDRFGVTDDYGAIKPGFYYFKSLTRGTVERLRKNPNIVEIKRIVADDKAAAEPVFPNHSAYTNTVDQWAPIYIPEKGQQIKIDPRTLPLYKRIITTYENNTLKVIGNAIYINGIKKDTYTFKQDYYWMMGDNRHNSIDSRFWGFVPFDHVVGKPVLTWLSWDKEGKKIRWERIFTTVNKKGEQQSYAWIPGLLLSGYILFYLSQKRSLKKSRKQ
ncbi:signal peptidase I [Zhouia amylolytica]|uniref:Signal peptidase I n=1 Tax=Zhouia amylolytica TaxID=376730 RepID=A0A1I6ULU1_9FLAO|nr:signal peptidase I [Zhouia amylolytica]MCQ0110674.1 signal peptidase I [Zhouia amylolytica]SFT02425.1 signal peptidase I [Zhouia amylolytica]